MSWWQCASRILCHHANASRRSPQLSSTLGPEWLPVLRDFAQHRKARDCGRNGHGAHRHEFEVPLGGSSNAPCRAPRQCECLACRSHIGRRSAPKARSKSGACQSRARILSTDRITAAKFYRQPRHVSAANWCAHLSSAVQPRIKRRPVKATSARGRGPAVQRSCIKWSCIVACSLTRVRGLTVRSS